MADYRPDYLGRSRTCTGRGRYALYPAGSLKLLMHMAFPGDAGERVLRTASVIGSAFTTVTGVAATNRRIG